MSGVDLSVIGKKTDPVVFDYTWKDVALYALSIGATAQELPYIYERTPGGIKVLPSFCVVPAMRAYPHVGDNVDLSRFLHGEMGISLLRPLSSEGRVILVGEVTDIYDKGKAAVYHIRVAGKSEEGTHLFDTYWVNFYVGAGGFGGDPGPKAAAVDPPKGVKPDYTASYPVAENQAALYRLNGDFNPLHLDPEFARSGGFADRPILHGLCTYGFAVRAFVNEVLAGDNVRLKSFKARFSSVVYPGDILTTKIWKESESRYLVQVETERGIALTNGVAETT